jgi:hypothetical protein
MVGIDIRLRDGQYEYRISIPGMDKSFSFSSIFPGHIWRQPSLLLSRFLRHFFQNKAAGA